MKTAVERCLAAAAFGEALDGINVKATANRRAAVRQSDIDGGAAPPSKKQKKRDAERRKEEKKEKGEWSKGYAGQRGVFLTLNGDAAAEDGEDGSDGDMSDGGEREEPAKPSKYAQYGPGADDEFTAVTAQPKNRKGQRARQAKKAAQDARKRGEKWDGSKNWREKKERDEDGNVVTKERAAEIVLKLTHHDSGVRRDQKVKKEEVAAGGKNWKEQGKAHPSWAAKKADVGIKAFEGKKTTFD